MLSRPQTRRGFLKDIVLAQAGLTLLPRAAFAAGHKPFSFILLGDLHFDKLVHHDLDSLQREKPDDVRQIRDYSRISEQILPQLFATIRETTTALAKAGEAPPAFVAQVGDLVEGLCGTEARAVQQNKEALEFVRDAQLGVPFVFTKGNHDVTGPGAAEAFKTVFHPYLAQQTRSITGVECLHEGARYSFEHQDAQFCFFDAYDKDSLSWLDAVLQRRTARHCFVVIHPPVVPYGARSLWHIFSREQEQSHREQLLTLLGKNNAMVLSGHIHKYNLLSRATPKGGRFLQLALSSVIAGLQVTPQNALAGTEAYNGDQVLVEPRFSPENEQDRRRVYLTEAPWVRDFQYADMPGYAVVTVSGPRVTASMYTGASRELWRTIRFDEVLRG